MAKKKKETSMPVVIALVFFVLSTVGLGVFCYVLYSEQADKDAAVVKVGKEAAAQAKLTKTAENKLKVYRMVLGIDLPEDRTSLIAEAKPGDESVAELKLINDGFTKRLANVKQADPNLPALEAKNVMNWAPDQNNALPSGGPTVVVLDSIAKALGQQQVAQKASDDKVALYDAAAKAADDKSKAYDTAATDLKATADKLKQDITAMLTKLQTDSMDRNKKYDIDVKGLRDKIDGHVNDIARKTTELKQREDQISGLKSDLSSREELNKKKEQFFDEHLGKVTRRWPDNTIEIDIGSADKARAGLTFSVLPADFPIKGYQSRVQVARVPDDRNVFREVSRFVEKATIEIVEVMGTHSSRARIVSESDPIRDRILVGDLLYNAIWRRGYSDHVALYGVFDTNGDGIDDIKKVVEDFKKMGIPVDAYFDLKEKKWVGDITPKTRYAIKGEVPNPSGNDPFAGQKAEINDAIAKASTQAKSKGITDVSYREIFPRMGYRVKLDVGDDRINQAVSPYLSAVGTAPGATPQP